MRLVFSLSLAFILSCPLLPGATLTVGPAGTYPTLQGAFNAANGLGGDHEIRIQQGTFNNGTTNFFVSDNLSLTISGGWNAAFSVMTSDPSLTVLSGGGTERVLNGSGSGSGSLQIMNLTVTQGFTEQSGSGLVFSTSDSPSVEILDCHFVENRGGFEDGSSEAPFGVALSINLNDDAGLRVHGCLFQDNVGRASSNSSGAGLSVSPSQNSRVEISECRFIGNEVVADMHSATGAAIHGFADDNAVVAIIDNLFEDNVTECVMGSSAGGAVYLGFNGLAFAQVSGNTFRRNTLRSLEQQANGGALYMTAHGQSDVLFEDNRLEGSRVEGEAPTQDGAGAFLFSTDEARIMARRNIWLDNSGTLEQGQVQLYLANFSNQGFILTDSLIAESSQGGVRGAGQLFWFTNVTIANHVENGIAFLDGDLNNSIVYGNGTDLASPGILGGAANLIGVDPFFADAGNGDYRLLPGSPGINAGSSAVPGGIASIDLAGQDRSVGSALDIGAYELQEFEHYQYLTQIGKGAQDSIVLSTEIDVASLLQEGDVAFTIDFYDSGGGRWELDLDGQVPAGEAAVSSISARLEPGQSWVINTSGTGEVESGYARIRGGEGIGVTGIFTRRHAPSGTILYQAGVPASEWLDEATLFVDSLGSLETGLAVVNVSNRQDFPPSPSLPSSQERLPVGLSGELLLRLHDETFTLLGETVLELAAGRHQASFVSQLFEGLELASEMRGILTVQSLDPVALVTLRQNDTPELEFPQEVPTLAAFPVLEGLPFESAGPEPAGVVPVQFFFAQIGNGQAGTIGLQTAVNLANLGAGQAGVQLDFFDSGGNPLELTLQGLGTGSSFDFNLGPGESRVLETDASGDIMAGYARVLTSAGVGGSAVFSRFDVPSGILETESGVPASLLGADFLLFVDTTANAETGLALANPGALLAGGGPPLVDLILLNMQGEELANRQVELPAGQHMARFVTQLFAGQEGIDEMRGLLRISSPVPIAAVTLLQNDDPQTPFPQDVGTLTAFPVLSSLP